MEKNSNKDINYYYTELTPNLKSNDISIQESCRH